MVVHPSIVPPEAANPNNGLSDAPPRFAAALRSIHDAQFRPEITLEEIPAPLRTAPFAVAIEGYVELPDSGEVADDDAAPDDTFGRIIVLYDPDGQDGWHGEFRVVTTIKASLTPELTDDPLLTEVAWSWVTEALAGMDVRGLAGTVTQVKSSAFGELGAEHRESVEIRASWSPSDDNLGADFEAWMSVLATAAGLEPLNADVTPISAAHGGHHGTHGHHGMPGHQGVHSHQGQPGRHGPSGHGRAR